MGHRPVELADAARFKFLQSAVLSPDGTRAVYGVSHVSADREDASKDKECTTLWLLSLNTGEYRQLTSGLYTDSDPQWSPDGRQIAFVSSRQEKAQVYVMPVDGGEPRPITEFKQGVSGDIAWSPDGSRIAFTASSQVEPVKESDPYRVTRSVYRFNGMGYLDQVVQDIYIVEVETREVVRLTHGQSSTTSPLWSPDGERLLYLTFMAPKRFTPFYDLRVCTRSGESRDIVTGDWGLVIAASWLPDGRIAFTGQPNGRRNGSKYDLWVVSADGGEPECRSKAHDMGFGGGLEAHMPSLYLGTYRPLVAPGSRFVYLPVQRGGTMEIAQVAIRGKERVKTILSGERACSVLSVNTGGVLFAVTTPLSPPDLYIAQLDGSGERQLTRLNDDLLAQLQMPDLETLHFQSTDDAEVEGWILKPSIGTTPYPTILYIHGGPHSGFGHTFSFKFHALTGAGYAVLYINQRGSTGYGDSFATAIHGDWGNLDFADLMAGVDLVIEKGIADPDRLGVCGLSGGGNLTCWIIGHTDRFKAAVPENPVTNWQSFYGVSDIGVWFATSELGGAPYEIPEVYTRCSPITYAHRCTTPTLLVQGEHDWRCPPEQSEQFYSLLKANECEVEMLRLPASAHAATIVGSLQVRRAHDEALLDWMNRYLLQGGQ